jgi:sodium/potassium-transporting ATPase subunit alpha
MNRMTVSHMWLGNKIVEVNITEQNRMHGVMNRAFEQDSSAPYSNKNNTPFEAKSSFDWSKLVRCAMLCNRSVFKDDPENLKKEPWKRLCTGDASEQALYQYTEVAKGKVVEYRAENKKLLEIPFNSTNKFQVSIHETVENRDQGLLLVMKGAPERMLERSSHILVNGETLELTAEWVTAFNESYEALGGMGERVLGFCDLRLDPEVYNSNYKFDMENINFPVKNLRFLGFFSLIDPPKPSVPEAVVKCRTAGISVFMVTGDHPITAKAIAQSVGIITEETKEDIAKRLRVPVDHVNPRDAKACVVHGASLIDMSAEDLDSIIRNHKEIVFARTSPQQKLIIVEACQRTKQLVGVTGDGVNDSPAMKKADIGISMGITGSDVSKQVADMVLLDDNFATIVTGVEEGRLIFDNIGKIVCYTFTKNLTELCPFIFYVLTDSPVALTTITMLCLDLGTDILPSISLSYEKAERGIMARPPRDPVKDKMANAKVFSIKFHI